MTSLEELEIFCRNIYESETPDLRSQAEQSCLSLLDSKNGFDMSLLLLEHGNSHYSQLIGISTMAKLIFKNPIDFSLDRRLEIRNICLNFLIHREQLADFVVTAIIELICRLTKHGWLDTDEKDIFVFREIFNPLTEMIKSEQPKAMLISVQILHNLVNEFNQSYEDEIPRSIILLRKIASNFRENKLYNIFVISIELLDKMINNFTSLNFCDKLQYSIVQYTLKLTLSCLSHDFIGTCGGEEICDDMISVQVPTSWRQAFLNPINIPDPVPLLFRLFKSLPSDLGSLTLSNLVQTASFRRSFFNNTERQIFLCQLVNGLTEILSINNENLKVSICNHEFTRLVCRLKSNFHLRELVAVTEYPQFVELLSHFTVRSFEISNNDNSNSQYFLLLTWQKFVSSLPYLRSSLPHLLDIHCPIVVDAYIRSRMQAVTSQGTNNSWDDFENTVSIPQEFDALAVLFRYQYKINVIRLASLFDEISTGFSFDDEHCVEIRLHGLCWLVLLMGTCINGRTGCAGLFTEDNDRLDGELISRVLQLTFMIDYECINSNCHIIQTLASFELSVLVFLDQLRKAYLCDESFVRTEDLVYEVLKQRINVKDENDLLEAIFKKIFFNLKCWSEFNRSVLSRSLALLHELSMGAVAKHVMKLPIVISFLENHSFTQLPFLIHNFQNLPHVIFGASSNNIKVKGSENISCQKSVIQMNKDVSANFNHRTCFYASLTRLFFLSPHAEKSKNFFSFMTPLTETCDFLTHSLYNMNTSTGLDQQINNKFILLSLIRDVRGVAIACLNKYSFQTLFNWLFPSMLSHLLIAIDLWGPMGQCGVSLGCLKLASKLCLSRNNRLQRDISSPNSEIIFRACSRIVICYGEKVTQQGQLSSARSIKIRYLLYIKEVKCCIDILRNLLSGNYANLGLFTLYADDTLEKCLMTVLQLMTDIPQEDLMTFPKISISYYDLVESLTEYHLVWLGTQKPEMILYFVNSICDGVMSNCLAISSSCCSSLDNVVSFLLRVVQNHNLSNNSVKPTHHKLSSLFLSDDVHASINNLFMSSNHLSIRDCQSRKTYYELLESSSGELLTILSRSMGNIFHALIQLDCKNQWAMSRPLLGLILLNNKAFDNLQQSYLSSSSQETLKTSFDKLMENVNCSLSIQNRDKFTQNLNMFRHILNGPIK